MAAIGVVQEEALLGLRLRETARSEATEFLYSLLRLVGTRNRGLEDEGIRTKNRLFVTPLTLHSCIPVNFQDTQHLHQVNCSTSSVRHTTPEEQSRMDPVLNKALRLYNPFKLGLALQTLNLHHTIL